MELTERSGIFHTMGLCELLQGPDLTNNLVGILLRFLQDPVALMGDVLSMFHQVRVPVAVSYTHLTLPTKRIV